MTWLRTVLLLLAVVTATEIAPAQTTGIIEGIVLDQSEAPVPGSIVTLRSAATNLSRVLRTDERGHYLAPGLPPGSYRATAVSDGFRPSVHGAVWLSAGRTKRVDFQLRIGERYEEMVVSDEPPLVSAAASDWGGTVERSQLAQLPLNGRDLFDLISQQPAVTIAVNNRGAMFTGLGVQPSVNGNRPNQNSFRLDGLYLNDATGSAPASANGRLLGVEAIQEIRLITNPFSAEYGRAASAVFTATSRSGSNDWHGSAYHFLRNSALDAKNFFDPPASKIPALRRNQYGGLIGGPLRGDRIFILANYEGVGEARGRTQRAVTLTEAARSGVLSGGAVAVSPLVKPFLDVYPMPNGMDYGDGTAEFISAADQNTRDRFFSARSDYLPNGRVRSSLRFSASTGLSEYPDPFLLWNLRTDSHFVFAQSETTFVQSAATLHSVRFGFTRVRNTENGAPPSLPDELTFVRGQPLGTLQVTGLTDITNVAASSLPRSQLLRNGQVNYELTSALGRHTFRFGAGYDQPRFRQRSDLRAGGRYRFTSLQNLLQARPAGADLMSPDSDTQRSWKQHQYSFFGQGEFRAAPNLNLMLGVRYEGYTSPVEAHGKVATLPDPLRDTALTFGGPLFANPSATNFAPRAGLAWDVFGSGSTVLRAGAGMFFDLLTSREVTIAGMRVPPFYKRVFMNNPAFPDLLAALGSATVDNSMDSVAYNVRQPYVLQFRFALERQLDRRTSLEIGYSGSRGIHLIGQFGDINVAQAQPDAAGRLFFPASGPLRNPAFGRIGVRTTDFNSFYHGLTLRLQRRMAAGLQLQAGYTWGKAIDESSSATLADFDNSDRMPHPYSIRSQRGRSDFDVRQSFNLNATWRMPSLRGGAAARIVGNWELLGLVQVQTGFPFNPRVGFDRARMRSGFGDLDQRPSLAAAEPPVIFGDPALYFDPMSFVLPPAGYLGNLGRNSLTGPGLFFTSLGFHRSLWHSESHEVRFRVEMFNATNHPNFDVPTELALFTNTGARIGSSGRITTTSTSARQIQLAIRWAF